MRGIQKKFGGTVALDGVDFAVHAGEVHALVGENGAGKSTLMKALSGAIRADEGTMELDGVPFRPKDSHAGRIAGVAMIYQELSLAPHLTVEENVLLGMEPTTMGLVRRGEARQRTTEALNQLGHANIDPEQRVASLSIAERQIVEIARSLAVGCRVLVLDEPTSTLSIHDIQKLFELIARLKRQGHAIVYISHFIEEVKQIADNFTVLRDGRSVGGGSSAEHSVEQIVGMMIGRSVEQLYPRSERRPGEVLLEIRELSSLPKPLSASLTLRRGEILGIAGLVGAGRTELLRALFGLAPVKSGTIKLGIYSGSFSPVHRWNQGAGLLSEDRGKEGLAAGLSVADNITMNLRREGGLFGVIFPRRIEKEALRWIRRLGIRARGPAQRVRDLSGGNQQKVAVARLLHEEVDVLLLDEPTRGIDVASKSQIYELIDRLATGDTANSMQPRAILMVSSYLPELLGVCDRIAVMHRGRLGPSRAVSEWDGHRLMLESTGGDVAA
ncbi:MAG: sugar ABC transporter ATP-binding protein [Bacteroidota bacterium]